MNLSRWEPEDIVVPDRLRKEIKEDAVIALMDSISQIGLREPPTIRIEIDEDGGEYPILIAGRHRVEACKRLGMGRIDCVVFDGDEIDARRWEIAENLHRAELTVQERAEHIAEWVQLTEKKQRDAAQLAPHQPKKAGQQPGGINAAVRELGIDRTEAQRSIKIAEIKPEVKEATKSAGIDNNQSALLRVAREKTAEKQLAAIQHEQEEIERRKREAKERRRQRVKGRIEQKKNETQVHNQGNIVAFVPTVPTEAQHFADWLMDRMGRGDFPKVISWLEKCQPEDVTAAIRREAA